MSKTWQLQEAKNRFSEVVEKALDEGPQVITRRGKVAVVVLSIKDFKKFSQPRSSLVEFFASSPLKGLKLDLSRSMDTGREVDLEVPD